MTLSTPSTIYGVHSLTLYNRTDLLPYGIIKVLGSLNLDMSGDFKDLYGGSSRYPWNSEPGILNVELKGKIKEIPNFAFERFLGASATQNSAEATGNVGTLTNQKGTSVMNSTTGIASATALSGSESDLKDGLYVVKAVTSTTVDVYAMTDVDFSKGTAKAFENDALKVTASPLTIVASTPVTVPGFGFKLTGGSGTIGMTAGDTAYVYVRKVNTGSDIITIGQSTATFAEFGVFIASQKLSDGGVFDGQLFKCRAIGLPLPLNEQSWLESDVTIKALYDSAQNGVMQLRKIRA